MKTKNRSESAAEIIERASLIQELTKPELRAVAATAPLELVRVLVKEYGRARQAQQAEIDRKAGIEREDPQPIRREGSRVVFGLMTPAQARAHLAEKGLATR